MSNNYKAYIFALCSPDNRYPNYKAWYLKIIKDDIDQIADMHELLMHMLNSKIGKDPHFSTEMKRNPLSLDVFLKHPMVLGLGWYNTALEFIEKYGVIYVLHNGAMFPADSSNFIEHSTRSMPTISFPTTDPNENIKIIKWKDGKHYYLHSSIYRIFPKDKYDTFKEAYTEASKYVKPNMITRERNKYE